MSDSENQISCNLNSACDCVHVLSSMVQVMGQRAGISDKQTNRMVLAVDELFANIAQHGYDGREGKVDMHADCKDGVLSFELRDYAAPVHDAAELYTGAPQTDAEISPGGLGLHLIHTVMDIVEHEALTDGNRWRLVKYLHGGETNEA
ncbi:MAG: ATP-binding protein [Mariprofundaceae bacterium]